MIHWTYAESDPALMLWTAAVERFGLDWPDAARILELGCAETDWMERVQRQNPGVSVTGVEVYPFPGGRPGTVVGSAMDATLFPPASFDAVVILGALEHFGLGFYGDPLDEDGDTHTMQNVARWLVPGGWVYFDVPCQPVYGVRPNQHFRDYAPASVQERLIVPGLVERCRGYSLPEPDAGTWTEAPTEPRTPYWFVAVVADKEAA